MSNIYIQEPTTFGKVLVITSVGDIEVELWSKETPKTSRNFVQLCMEGYYNGTIFHRVVKGFIAQGGDPTGTGMGGESIYGQPFKDEFHSRLRFSHRGLIAMANSGKDDNGSQFFFTFGPCPELQNKNTIFGKVVGDTIFNMLKLESGETDSNERPIYPQKILRTEVLSNPFPDIVPRCVPSKKEKKKKSSEEKKVGVKNFKLLSFGEEAQEDEEENREISLSLVGKGKSTHDVLDDPKLSSIPALDLDDEELDPNVQNYKRDLLNLETVKEKLKSASEKSKSMTKRPKTVEEKNYPIDEESNESDSKRRRLEEIRKEIKDLKRSYQRDKKPEERKTEEKEAPKRDLIVHDRNEYIDEYNLNLEKYSSKQKKIPMKGSSREEFTMSLLTKFKQKIAALKNEQKDDSDSKNDERASDSDSESGDKWMVHKLIFEDDSPVVAKDANLKNDEWFDITDPRHAINKRRRESGKNKNKI